MVLREGRHAVITFIDYRAAFDTESQLFLDRALADAGVSVKVRRIIQAILAAATGVVRIRQPSGDNMLSDSFNIERGVLQCDIFSPVCFIAGLDRIFRLHDVANSGMVVGEAESAILVSKFEYADDAALVDENAALASTRVTALAIGLYRDVWIAAIASSTTSLATRRAAICVRFQGRRVRRVYVTMQITFLTRKSALIYRRGLRQRVASLTLNCNGDFAIRAYWIHDGRCNGDLHQNE